MKGKLETYYVMCNGHCEKSTAVSADKAINNVRWRMFKATGNWYNVPKKDEFDAVKR